MANTFKNIRKKLRRKRLLAEKRRLEKAQSGTRSSASVRRKFKSALRKRKAVLRPVAAVLAVGLVVLLGFLFLEKRSYHGYKVQAASGRHRIHAVYQFVGQDPEVQLRRSIAGEHEAGYDLVTGL